MPSIELVVVLLGGGTLCLNLLVFVCLRGTTPEQRPAILRALAVLVRSAWPTWRSPETPPEVAGRPGQEADTTGPRPM